MSMGTPDRIYLSAPHLTGYEADYVEEALKSNWIAPLGPQVDAFEREFSHLHGGANVVALSSGTAALHLALICAGVAVGDEVLVSTLTFAGSVFPICYLNARPTFIDSDITSWNMDPGLLDEVLEDRSRRGRLPAAVVVAHLYGQSADLDPIVASCARFDVPVIEDAAEALGGTYKGRRVGTFGHSAIFSFNGNKIVTTSGGGMLLSPDGAVVARARKLATQAREAVPHYEHAEIGYNYRMSNILAALGRGQLRLLNERVEARRRIFARYCENFTDVRGIEFMPEAPYARHARWLTCLTIDPDAFGADREAVRSALEEANIEARPLWKPMHLQPVFAGAACAGGTVAEHLFNTGLCLPSGSYLTDAQVDRISDIVRATAGSRSAARIAP
jgi:dTDP-4-amino-4,6-dideoxygalactose transaminase